MVERQADLEKLKDDVADMKVLLEASVKNTAEVMEFWDNLQAGVKVLGWLGRVAKWVAGISAAVSAVVAAYYSFKSGGPIR